MTVPMESQFAELEERAKSLIHRIEEAERRGIPMDHQRVAWVTASDFLGYCREDLSRGLSERASAMAEEIDTILGEAHSRLDRIMAGRATPIEVPRYRTSRLDIAQGHFTGRIRWRDGEEELAPVIFTGYGHFDQVKRDLPKFPDYGINIIQIEIGPSSTLLPSGDTDWGRLKGLLPVFSLAAEHDVAVNLLTSPHYFPGWAIERDPELGKCEGGFIRFCIDAPQARAIIEKHLGSVMEALGGLPALHSICLSNEPVYRSCADDPNTLRLWSDHLAERFNGDIERARSELGHSSPDFGSFPVPSWKTVEPTPLYYEWCLFNQRRFAAWHEWMANVIHEISPGMPVHAKIMPTCTFRKNVADGVDPGLFCRLSQINGNDCWCMFQHGEGEYAQDWLTQSFFYDLLRSSKDNPVFNSENHLIRDRERKAIPWQHIRSALWQGAIHGQCATTIWVWERTCDDSSDFAGSIMHRPLCARAAGETGLDLMRFSKEVTALQRVPPQVGLLNSMASIVYDEDYLPEAKRVYEALNFTGRRIAFISGDQLAAPGLPPVLVVPSVHVEADTFSALEKSPRRDVKIIFCGRDCCTRNEHDRPFAGRIPADRVLPSGLPPRELRKHLWDILGASAVRPLCADRQPCWGIEWIETHLGDRWIMNSVNLLGEPQLVTWFGADGPLTVKNLFTDKLQRGPVTMPPMEPMLAELSPAQS